MEIKICGINEISDELLQLPVQYLGFIFHEHSPRNCTLNQIQTPKNIQKVGVFVNETLEFIQSKVNKFGLDVIQLHGQESEEFCQEIQLQNPQIKIWKTFHIEENFNAETIKTYNSIDKILLEPKGKNPGGNGFKFDWQILETIETTLGIILSGGISEDDFQAITDLKQKKNPISIIDINSRFEISPGKKDIPKIQKFIQNLKPIL